MYAHLSRVDVKVGQAVAAGAIVAAVGSSGISSGPHLHFEVRLRGAATDPLRALR
jgi:murein DD-endopeptidase MepM/ murein hydrolase activator NlpD